MFVIRFLNITCKSRNFHAFTQAYLAHAQTNFPAAHVQEKLCAKYIVPYILLTVLKKTFNKMCVDEINHSISPAYDSYMTSSFINALKKYLNNETRKLNCRKEVTLYVLCHMHFDTIHGHEL